MTDSSYLSRTPASLFEEFYGDLYDKRDELAEVLETGVRDPVMQSKLFERLQKIRILLDGESPRVEKTGDQLIDSWEAAIERGEDPDLEAGLSPELLAKMTKKDA